MKMFDLLQPGFFSARGVGKRIGCGFLAVAVGWMFLAALKAHADPLLLVLLGLLTVLPAFSFLTPHGPPKMPFED